MTLKDYKETRAAYKLYMNGYLQVGERDKAREMWKKLMLLAKENPEFANVE